jgi:hypothetical protein
VRTLAHGIWSRDTQSPTHFKGKIRTLRLHGCVMRSRTRPHPNATYPPAMRPRPRGNTNVDVSSDDPVSAHHCAALVSAWRGVLSRLGKLLGDDLTVSLQRWIVTLKTLFALVRDDSLHRRWHQACCRLSGDLLREMSHWGLSSRMTHTRRYASTSQLTMRMARSPDEPGCI